MEKTVEIDLDNETFNITHNKQCEISPVSKLGIDLRSGDGDDGLAKLTLTIHHSDREVGRKIRKSLVGSLASSGFVGATRVCDWGTIKSVDKRMIVIEHKAKNKSQSQSLKASTIRAIKQFEKPQE